MTLKQQPSVRRCPSIAPRVVFLLVAFSIKFGTCVSHTWRLYPASIYNALMDLFPQITVGRVMDVLWNLSGRTGVTKWRGTATGISTGARKWCENPSTHIPPGARWSWRNDHIVSFCLSYDLRWYYIIAVILAHGDQIISRKLVLTLNHVGPANTKKMGR